MKLRIPTLGELTDNWRLKLAALGLAVLIWAVVSAEQPTTQWIPVRVEAQVQDPDFVVAGAPEPTHVQVRFSGPGRELWELALDRPRILLSVRDVGEQRVFPLQSAMVRVPPGLSVSVLEIRPQFARLELQRLASRVLPVAPQIGPRSLQRFVVTDDLEVIPAEIRVTGPAERLAALDALPTLPFEIVPDDSVFSHEVQIDTAGMEGLSFSRTRVRVSGAVETRSERTVPGIAVYVPDGLVARPSRVDARVQGGRRTLLAIFAPTLRAVVPRDSLPARIPPEGVEVPVVFDGLPAGTTARAMPLRVRVYPQGQAPAAPTAEPPASPAASPDTLSPAAEEPAP
jgi:hypothetical protein